MTRKTAEPLTPLELEIMKVLWETGPASVQTVQEGLAAERTLAYNTVQTMLNVLLRKGKVKREIQGRAYLYEPVVSRPQTARLAVSDLVHRMFDGSAESLVLSLVETRQLTPEKLAELSKLLDGPEGTVTKKGNRHED
ncbi:MAG TPA: BlaI/MecI/CopY family transcriptional regulator [Thermoanaerobaculia bacterium]|jgi:predicted transcriptional regulator|nr:BlaI/MecI/CopY family transcriptional regulator [Thermoanaerobaculia bacterium]